MNHQCPLEHTLKFLKSKWCIFIIRELSNETKRFNELEKSIHGVSQKVLTENLRFLEANSIITRTVYPVVPPKVEYSLTVFGASLLPIIEMMMKWGEENASTQTKIITRCEALDSSRI